jgi:hypothetical protein
MAFVEGGLPGFGVNPAPLAKLNCLPHFKWEDGSPTTVLENGLIGFVPDSDNIDAFV